MRAVCGLRSVWVMAVIMLALTAAAAAKCMPFTHAPDKIGAITCVAGKVVKVSVTRKGTHFLNFCADYKTCPFTVVVFASRLRDVGDVRLLEGTDIEVSGRIKAYRGKAEIVLNDARQLKGDAGKLPPLPKEYEASRHGSYRAGDGRLHSGSSARQTGRRPRQPAAEMDEEQE